MLKSEFRELVRNPYRAMEVADRLREEVKGNIVTFVVNRNINFTDMCVNSCLFCSYRNRKRFFLSEEEIKSKVMEAVEYGCTELTIQGGLFPGAGVEDYVRILRAVREV